MNINFYNFKTLVILASLFLTAVSCETVTVGAEEGEEEQEERAFSIAMAVGSGSVSTTYVQNLLDLSKGTIGFDGYGFEVPSSRTARIFTSSDGKSLYDLDYGGGRIYKFELQTQDGQE